MFEIEIAESFETSSVMKNRPMITIRWWYGVKTEFNVHMKM